MHVRMSVGGFRALADWRRLVYRIVGDNAYEELMYRESVDRWDQLAEFKFTREAN